MTIAGHDFSPPNSPDARCTCGRTWGEIAHHPGRLLVHTYRDGPELVVQLWGAAPRWQHVPRLGAAHTARR